MLACLTCLKVCTYSYLILFCLWTFSGNRGIDLSHAAKRGYIVSTKKFVISQNKKLRHFPSKTFDFRKNGTKYEILLFAILNNFRNVHLISMSWGGQCKNTVSCREGGKEVGGGGTQWGRGAWKAFTRISERWAKKVKVPRMERSEVRQYW